MPTGAIDVLFLARNRLEFTREALETLKEGTEWPLVETLYLYDDQSSDGTREYLESMVHAMPVKTIFCSGIFNGPMPVLLDCVAKGTGELICKVDNDTLMPPGWLRAGLSVIVEHNDLDLLGIGYRDQLLSKYVGVPLSYEEARFVGGIGIFRRRVLCALPNLPCRDQSWHGINQADMKVGWLYPNALVVLLDRIPFQPWVGHSERYEKLGWQRNWGRYAANGNRPLWGWWLGQREQRGETS